MKFHPVNDEERKKLRKLLGMPEEPGKPRTKIRERIARHQDPDSLRHFDTPEMLALYYSWVAEAPSCWPRVLDGTMTQDRLQERSKRMREAILPHLLDK